MLGYKKGVVFAAAILSCCFISAAYSYWNESLYIYPVLPAEEEELVTPDITGEEDVTAPEGTAENSDQTGKENEAGAEDGTGMENNGSVSEAENSDQTEKENEAGAEGGNGNGIGEGDSLPANEGAEENSHDESQ